MHSSPSGGAWSVATTLAAGFPISATSFALFQGMFAIITPALISGALLTWCLINGSRTENPTPWGAATGVVAGLVGITPAAGFVYMENSILIGIITPVACFVAVRVKASIQFDDSLDTFMVHGVGGTVGALLT